MTLKIDYDGMKVVGSEEEKKAVLGMLEMDIDRDPSVILLSMMREKNYYSLIPRLSRDRISKLYGLDVVSLSLLSSSVSEEVKKKISNVLDLFLLLRFEIKGKKVFNFIILENRVLIDITPYIRGIKNV